MGTGCPPPNKKGWKKASKHNLTPADRDSPGFAEQNCFEAKETVPFSPSPKGRGRKAKRHGIGASRKATRQNYEPTQEVWGPAGSQKHNNQGEKKY